MTTRTCAFAAIVLATACGSAAAAPGPCALAALKWMAGSWLNEQEPDRAKESWIEAPDGVLMGSAFEFPRGKTGYAEIMTIRDEDGTPTMRLRHFDGALDKAWEERDAPMAFRAASCDGTTATFDGQGERLGEHLAYHRTGDHLLVVADFLHGGKPLHLEWHMVAAPR